MANLIDKFFFTIALSLLAVIGGPENLWVIVIASLIAIFGSMVDYLNGSKSLNCFLFIRRIVTGAFIGGLVGFGALYLNVSIYGAAVIAGLFGWMGTEALIFAKKVLHKKFNIKFEERDNSKENKEDD